MAKKGEARENTTIVCTVCNNEKRTEKNKRNTPERLELKVYCPKCRKHTLHKEKK